MGAVTGRGEEQAPVDIEVTIYPGDRGEDAIAPVSRRRSRVGPIGPVGYVLAGGLVVAALVVGYLLGQHHERGARPSAVAARSASAVASAGSAVPLGQTRDLCATQIGAQLQLGLELVNPASVAVTLRQVAAVLPLGGLRATSVDVGACGQLLPARGIDGTVVAPGATIWVAITFDVLVTCPRAYPVQFSVEYVRAGAVVLDTFAAFDDLGRAAYSGCNAS